jgi:hypothetical protein
MSGNKSAVLLRPSIIQTQFKSADAEAAAGMSLLGQATIRWTPHVALAPARQGCLQLRGDAAELPRCGHDSVNPLEVLSAAQKQHSHFLRSVRE